MQIQSIFKLKSQSQRDRLLHFLLYDILIIFKFCLILLIAVQDTCMMVIIYIMKNTILYSCAFMIRDFVTIVTIIS